MYIHPSDRFMQRASGERLCGNETSVKQAKLSLAGQVGSKLNPKKLSNRTPVQRWKPWAHI